MPAEQDTSKPATAPSGSPADAKAAPEASAAGGVVKTPPPAPAPGVQPPPAAKLSAEEQAKYDELLRAVEAWDKLPTTAAKNAARAELADRERMWLTRECLERYLRATRWSVDAAAKRLQETLVWRREYGTWDLAAAYVSDENATGKQVVFGFDTAGRPCLYLLPNRQNTRAGPKQVQHLVYMLETAIELAPPGQDMIALLIDFRKSSASSNPSVGTGKQVLNILQNHYPERLGRALITHRTCLA